MSTTADKPPLLPSRMSSVDPKQALRRLFLTLFLRGRSSRGLNQKGAPKSIAQKLFVTLLFYTFFGCTALPMMRQHVFAVAVYLHAMTFTFLGMFVATSCGEILFNKEEADILLHRPIEPRMMLWAKIRVLIEIALWCAGCLNFAGLFAGVFAPDGGWLFVIAHITSTVLETFFCVSCVILLYQLCLRWLGRERLDGIMTTVQVLLTVLIIVSSQLLPRIIIQEKFSLSASESPWWISLLPPAWFAGIDDAIAGSSVSITWIYASVAVVATGITLWLAFGKLAGNYESGLQSINENVSRIKPAKRGRRWLERLVSVPPLRWWLRDPVSRASFLLTTAYLLRDRDVKLRIYPGIAPMLVVPFVFLLQRGRGPEGFGIAFSGAYLGLIPLLALGILQYSQQWQASDIFRVAPTRGPGDIYNGARRAVLCLLALPMFVAVGGIILIMHGLNAKICLLLPGFVALPVYSLVPGLLGKCVPLSRPIEEGKAASRSLIVFAVMIVSIFVSLIGSMLWDHGWFWPFLLAETIVSIGLYIGMRHALAKLRWKSAE